jgi:hypothetical protein
MKNHIYGLTGFAGVGKDTVADLLVSHGFRKLAFADALRGELANAFGVSIDLFTKPIAKERPQQALSLSRAPKEAMLYIAEAEGAKARVAPLGAISETWLDTPRSPRQLMQWWAPNTAAAKARSTGWSC